MLYTWLLVIITIVIIIALIAWEYRTQDCIGGKPCRNGFRRLDGIDFDTEIEEIIAMVTVNENYQTWRLSLIVAIILTIPVCYLLLRRMPNLEEYLSTALIIFVGCYFSSSWLWSHWIQPNNAKIKDMLIRLNEGNVI